MLERHKKTRLLSDTFHRCKRYKSTPLGGKKSMRFLFIGALTMYFLSLELLDGEPSAEVSGYSLDKTLKNSAQDIDQQNGDASLEQYQKLLELSPDNVDYLLKVGKLNKDRGQNQKAIEYFLKARSIQPTNPDVNVYLGFAYLTEKNLEESKKSFRQALENFPNYADALAGLGRISSLNKNSKEAEEYYRKALKIDPNNLTTLEYMAALRKQQERYTEAHELYQKLHNLDPKNDEYKKSLENTQNKQVISEFKEKGNDVEAINHCVKVIEKTQDIDFYLELGKIYNRKGMRLEALEIYNQALELQPTNTDILNALAFTYMKLALEEDNDQSGRNLANGEMLFHRVLGLDPKNIEALAGLGAIATANDYQTEAEGYFSDALNIDSTDSTTLNYLAFLRNKQKYYFSARDIYRYLLCLDPTDDDSRLNLRDNKYYTEPTVSLIGFYDEENEKIDSPTLDAWIARLKNYGGILKAVIPVSDCLNLSGALVNEYTDLKQLLNHTTIYSLGIRRAFINATWKNGYYLTTYGGFGFSSYEKHLDATFRTKHGKIFLPNLGFNYSRRHHLAILETNGDAIIVDRNFENNTAKLIGRQFLRGFYEYEFGRRMLVGAEAANAWYFDMLHNREQRVAAWLQLTPPTLWNNISLRYTFNYRNFKDLTLSYYTYKDQVTNWFQLDLYKEWTNKIFVHATYSYGYQRSFESGEIITVTPSPFHWLTRRINTVFAEAGAQFEHWTFLLQGYYYQDSFEYTVASGKGSISLTF